MANTNEVKKRLNQHRNKAIECETIRKELENAIERYGDVKAISFDGMPKGKGGDNGGPTERQVLRKIALEDKLKKRETELEADWRKLEPLMSVLSPTEALVIKMRYDYAEEWSEICRRIYGQNKDFEAERDGYYNRVFKMHGRALLALAKIFRPEN